MKRLIVFFAICRMVAVADARVIHVNNLFGDDHNNGSFAETTSGANGPVRTIGQALRIATFADRVSIANTGTPYRESVVLHGTKNSGSKRNPFVMDGNGAVLEGATEMESFAWSPATGDVVKFVPNRIQFQQLFLDGKPLKRMDVTPGDYLSRLKPFEYCRLRNEIYLRLERDRLPVDLALTYANRSVGITLYQVDHAIIRDLVVQNFRVDGISAIDNAFDCKLEDVTTRGNGRAGLTVGGASTLRFESCNSGDNGVSQVRTEGWSELDVVNCELLDNSAPAWRMEGGRLRIDGQSQTNPKARKQYRIPLHRP